MSLVTLLVALAANGLVALLVLPRYASDTRSHLIFRAWYWLDQKAALYGWVLFAVGLLAWDYFVWKEARPKVKGWFTRKLLTLSLATGIAPMIPWWVPAGQPPTQFLALIGRYPGVPAILAWAVVLVVSVLLCIDAESRDYLLGHGRTLSVISTSFLLVVLTLTVLGWSLAY